ncbi:hypothetical protein O6H91_14G080900 [Diphasiastrum complanatum]|uniref:Uncharacterized protein n=1 Tax=Diphasiastrum complanatum TaxID=34168 RepID=A0ACC2BRG3_DIPCM|nr:hypothetical protein O6H91_14G080900 [Diphasiastrum complanatum]
MKRNLRTDAKKETSKRSPFEVVYELKEGMVSKVWVTLFCSHLIGIVKNCLPRNKQVFSEKPKIAAQELFLANDRLRNYQLPESGANVAKLHLSHLMRFLEMEYKDTLVHYKRMQREGTTSWEMLWTFFTSGQKVLYHCDMSDEQVCGIVEEAQYSRTSFDVQLDM